MHTFTVALAIGTALALGGCGTQDGGSRDQPLLPAAGVPAGQPAPGAPPHADPPPGAPAARPAAPAAPLAQPEARPAVPPAAAPAAPPAPPAIPSAAAAPASPPAAPAAPSANQSPDDAAAERDQRISREVRAGLTRDSHLARDAKDVQVTTSAGVVTLTGTVSSDADRRAIRSQAERVSGVVRVEDQLVVR